MVFEAWNDVNQFGLYLKNNEITFFKNDNPNPVSIWIIEHDWIFYFFIIFQPHHPDGSWFWWILLKLDFISIEITKNPYFGRFSYPSSLFTTFQKTHLHLIYTVNPHSFKEKAEHRNMTHGPKIHYRSHIWCCVSNNEVSLIWLNPIYLCG